LNFRQGKLAAALAALVIFSVPVTGTFYEVTESETGWTTGTRQTLNASFELTGSTIGKGTYQRYTDLSFNDVRMRENIAAKNGTLDTAESISLQAEDVNDVVVTLIKNPGNQDYYLTVNETWPVALSAARRIDYIGKGISDRDIFGNNFDYVGSSYLYTTDLKKERACYMDLQKALFEMVMNNTTKGILVDRFLPAKRTYYELSSRSTGIADLKYRQTSDHSVANEGFERYEGTMEIRRSLSMISPGLYNTTSNETWLECGPVSLPYFEANESNDQTERPPGA
jgi:hypothetical protein